MKTAVNVIFSMLAGIAIGSVGVQVLEAQIRPSAYVIAEADVTDRDAYNREYLPLFRKLLMDGEENILQAVVRKLSPSMVSPHGLSLLSPLRIWIRRKQC